MDNTKTAEEILKSQFPHYAGTQWGKGVIKCMEEYASPLKKRIEELEYDLEKKTNAATLAINSAKRRGERIEELEAERDHFETLYKQGLVIIDTLNPSTNGKQDPV